MDFKEEERRKAWPGCSSRGACALIAKAPRRPLITSTRAQVPSPTILLLQLRGLEDSPKHNRVGFP